MRRRRPPHPAVRARRLERRVSNRYRPFAGPRSNRGSRPSADPQPARREPLLMRPISAIALPKRDGGDSPWIKRVEHAVARPFTTDTVSQSEV
jgi:hypothetical protein